MADGDGDGRKLSFLTQAFPRWERDDCNKWTVQLMAEMAAVVGWYGPYPDIAAAYAAAARDYDGGLYVAFGYPTFPARGRPRFLYVGVGAPLSSRLTQSHHAIGYGKVGKITSVWLGEIMSHMRPGRREKKIEPLIDAVEWAMISLLGPCKNVRKTSFPDSSFAILNRWYSREDYETPQPKPAVIWPDIIECAGAEAPAHFCWLDEGKVRRFERPPRRLIRG